MEITNDIRQAALTLGEALRSTQQVQDYLLAKADLQADAQANSLELSLDAMVESLLARQQTGEDLNPEEMDAYHALRSQVWGNPLIRKRTSKLGDLQPLFAYIADDIQESLGVEFTSLAVNISE